MTAKITYYAIVDDFTSRERPAGVLRRIIDDESQDDAAFTTNLKWEHSDTLRSYEHGSTDVSLYEIGETEAYEIVARVRRAVMGEPDE